MSNLTMKALQEQINRLNEEVAILKANSKTTVVKRRLGIGDAFVIAGLEWKILDITEKGYMCFAERLKDDRKFDSSCNDWKESSLRKYLASEFYNNLSDEIGADNIVPFERDLLSLDGQTEYGKCVDNVSLLTVDEYRKYRNLIPNASYWWWTITPDSTKCNADTNWVRVVSPSGSINYYGYDCSYGVHPFCIFSSSLFESEE